MCLVTEFGYFDCRIFTEALSNNDVRFVAMPIHGGVSRINKPIGYKVYVRYYNYGEAVQTFDTIWGGNGEADVDADDDPASVINSLVRVIIDRPLGSRHPEHPDIKYGLNYGYVDGVTGGDGEAQDAYIIGINAPLLRMSVFDGYVGGNCTKKRRGNKVGSSAYLRRNCAPYAKIYQGTNCGGSRLSRKIFRYRNNNLTIFKKLNCLVLLV